MCLCVLRTAENRTERKSERVSTAAVINARFDTAEVNAGSELKREVTSRTNTLLSLCFSLSRQFCCCQQRLFSTEWSQTEQSRTARITHTHILVVSAPLHSWTRPAHWSLTHTVNMTNFCSTSRVKPGSKSQHSSAQTTHSCCTSLDQNPKMETYGSLLPQHRIKKIKDYRDFLSHNSDFFS